MKKVLLQVSDRKNKKYVVYLLKNGKLNTIHFGGFGHGDYPFYFKNKGKKFANEKRSQYYSRHMKNEDWSESGIYKAGFWSKHLLWWKPTIEESIKEIENKFNLKIEILK